MADSHWLLRGVEIVVPVNDGGYSVIATIHNERAVRQMLRYTQLGQEVEHLADQWYAGKLRPYDTVTLLILLVASAIKDTSSREVGVKIPCPEVEQKE